VPRITLERGPVVAERGELATTMWSRTRGLLGRAGMEEGEGLWIQPTSSIHMWFMRFPIDVVWAAADGRVLKLTREIKPWRMAWCRRAKVALELPAGTIDRAGVEVGDHLVIER
jgi:uncharacterized membrane protein (UPF0127 family)